MALTLDQAAQLMLDRASSEFALPADELIIFGPDPIALPDDTGTFAVGVVATADAMTTVTLYVDLDSGRVLAEAEWDGLADAVAASMEPYTIELREQLAAASDTDLLTVGVGVYGGSRAAVVDPVLAQFPDAAIDGQVVTVDPELSAVIQDALVTAWMASAQTVTAPLVAEAMGLGMKVEYVGRSAPVFWVTGTKDQIAALSAADSVLTVYPSSGTAPAMNIARLTDQANYSDSQGWDGQGIRVAVVEYQNVLWTNANFNGANCKESYSTDGLSYASNHPTWVMGAIGGQVSPSHGVAKEACLISVGTGGYVENATDFEILEAVDIAVDPAQGDADIINLSLVQDTTAGRTALRDYIDQVVRMGIAVTAAAGNVDQCPDQKVPSPGSAWNVVTVGTIGDKNTSQWGDDDVGNHCWVNPTGGTFKPEISAPGQGVTAAGVPPNNPLAYLTSIATPQVAGTMAQLMEIRPSELRGSPLQVRAIILAASHAHMVDAQNWSDRISPTEGMGSLTAKWADIVAARTISGGFNQGNFGKKLFYASGQDPVSGCWTRSASPLSQTLSIAPGTYVRVVAAWNSNGFYSDGGNGYDPTDFSADYLDANFDIRVYTASGALKAFHSSSTYNVENVQFTALTGESPYRLDIIPTTWPCSVSSHHVAWAWVSWNTP